MRRTHSPRVFSEAELDFVAAVADQIAVALEHAREHWRESRTDYLTGLANRPKPGAERFSSARIRSNNRRKFARTNSPSGSAA